MKVLFVLSLILLVSCTSKEAAKIDKKKIKADIEKFNNDMIKKYDTTGLMIDLPYFELDKVDVDVTVKKLKMELKAGYDTIAALKEKQRSYNNTFYKLDSVGDSFNKSLYRLSFLSSVSKSKELRDAAKKAVVELESFSIEQGVREDVYLVLSLAKSKFKNLSVLDKRMVDEVMLDYKRMGFGLSKEVQNRVKEIKKELGELKNKISSQIDSDKTLITLTDKEASTIPAKNLESLKKNKNGKYSIYPGVSYQFKAVMTYSNDELLRKKVFVARTTRAKENQPLMEKVIRLRAKAARLLNYKNHADYRLEVKMAKNAKTAIEFEKKLIKDLDKKFLAEIEILQNLKRRETKKPDAKINSWDVGFYTNIYRKENFDLDLDSLKKYFEMDKVMSGMFKLFEDLFEIKVTELTPPYKWDEKIRLVLLEDKVSGKPLGYLFLDLYPRPEDDKYGHFAMFGMRGARVTQEGIDRRPYASLVCNFPLPTNGKPSLLTYRNVETLFHEFGHALHHIMSQSKYSRFAGVNVPRDFVEAPSQMLEYWVHDKKVLDTFAVNYQDPTDKIPGDIIEKINKADIATKGITYRRQLALGMMDLDIHMNIGENENFDIVKKTNQVLKDVYLEYPEGTSFITGFGHLFGGYDAGYYGYAWADNIAADLASKFKVSKNTFFDKKIGKKLRDELYQVGNSRDINDSIKAFLGRDVSSESFYKGLGL